MGKCADCGYLALRNKHDQTLGEADCDYRQKAVIANVYDDKGMNPHSLYEQRPLCLARSSDLRVVFKPTKDGIVKDERGYIVDLLNEERVCSEFAEWHQGFTPKEHREMADRDKMLKWQIDREESDKQFRLKMASDEKSWQAGQQTRLAIIAGIFVILGAIIGALIANRIGL